jgi:two-component system sensor kinase
MLVAAHRSEEVGPDHLLRRVPTDQTLRLGSLTPQEVRLLVESMAGPLPKEAIELIAMVSDGSPFLASAVLRGLVETGALTPRDGDWDIDSVAMAECRSSNRAALFLSRRIDMLSHDTRELLSAGAVLGREFELDLAAELTGFADLRQIEALDEARRRHLVWLRPDDSTCVFIHDKIRETLLDQLPAERRKQLHLAAAEQLIAKNQLRDVELAFHYDAAGQSRLALPFALRAADQARSRYVLSVAEQQYEIARRGGGDLPSATRFRIAEELGDVSMLRGDYDRAERLFEEARQLASGNVEVAAVLGKLAELSFKRGDMEKSARDYERALQALGISSPKSSWRLGLSLLFETAIQLAHTAFPSRVHRLGRSPDEVERLTLRLISGLSHAYWYLRSKPMILWAHLRGLNEAERFKPSLELAHLYADHAPAMSLITYFSRAYRYAQKSLAIREQFGDVWGQGHSLNYYGVALYAASRYEECISKCREAIRLLERTGDYWQVHIARYQIAVSLYRLGDFLGAQREAQRNHLSGIELGDEQTSGVNLDVWARVTHGKVPRDILERELQRERFDAQGTCHVLLADGVCQLADGQFESASRVLRRAIDVATGAGIHNAYSMPARAWYATALRQVAEATSHFAPRQRRLRLAVAHQAAQQALRASWVSKNDLPHIYRELALISALLGKLRRSAKFFAKSLAWAERLKAEYERATTLVEWGTVGLENGWPQAQEKLDQGEWLLTRSGLADERTGRGASGPKQTLSLADRFDTLLNDGRQIASALSESDIYELARVASIRLLRGEHCYVVKLNAQEASPAFHFVGAPTHGINQEIVKRALSSGKTIAAVDELADEEGDAALISRSVICAPIKVRDAVTAFLYVTHDQVRNLFGETEIRLADFVATIAGAACENAEGFAQLQLLNETLEQRVAERTAAAEARAVELAQSNTNLERVANELRQTEDQLRIAIKQAEAANEAKSRFLATMSHEIRTPMNGILGMTELALKSSPSSQQRNCLNVVKQSGDALMTLLNDILDLSKIEAGKLDLESIPVEVRGVVENAVRLFSTSAYGKRLELICRVAADTPAIIKGDPNRLRQIVINLLGNALKFTDEGSIDVQVWPEAHNGIDCLHFRVRDTGIGIPADKQQLIFEAFRQSDSSTTRRFGGTGLGLSISQNLVELMNGRIWVTSQIGQGSEFHFVVPLHVVASADIQTPFPGLAGRHIGLISSDPVGGPVYREMLEGFGLVVHGYPDLATAATDATTVSALDALVFDNPVGTPVPSASDPQCTLIVLSFLDDVAGQQCRHVSKPVMRSELLEVIASTFDLGVKSAEPATLDCTPTRPATTIRILLADDSPVNQEVAVGLLEFKGYEVRVANNGLEALAAIQSDRFALVLMDLEMPKMDGFEATAAIRAHEAGLEYSTPIIAMTAHATQEIQERCAAAGMNGYVSKPVDPDKLFSAVENAVGA